MRRYAARRLLTPLLAVPALLLAFAGAAAAAPTTGTSPADTSSAPVSAAPQWALPQGVVASSISDCTTSKGTIIAVDYAHWGGPIVVGCDLTNPKGGIDLLNDAGFTTAGDQHDGPAFLCRIGNRAYDGGTQFPTPAQDPCIVTPPASAYWSYWLAPAEQNSSWSYSQLGAYSGHPLPGEIELWIFGGTNDAGTLGRPTCTPASLRPGAAAPAAHCSPVGSAGSPSPSPTSTASPSPTTHHPATPAPTSHSSTASRTSTAVVPPHSSSSPTSRTGSDRTSSPAPTRSTGRTTSSGTSAPTHSSSTSTRRSTQARASRHSTKPTASASSTSTSTRRSASAAVGSSSTSASPSPSTGILAAESASTSRGSVGSAMPLVIGAVLVALLAGAGLLARRRRSSS